MADPTLDIIGAGLAGCEAAWQAANRGIKVRLHEMKPLKYTPAHHSEYFAELVCSNSLRSDRLENAVGLLKEEMRLLDSLIMRCADSSRLPAGGALAVDREGFSSSVTDIVKKHPGIYVITQEVTTIPEKNVIIATGPLTSDALLESITGLVGSGLLYFHDAAAPIVTYDSIDMEKAFRASRYCRGGGDYINCPMDRKQYENFRSELIKAEIAPMKSFEKEVLFNGCMPVESMAAKGFDTLRFGPLKPVGLTDPRTGREPYAVAQLRQDNSIGTLYNIVGFQSHLKWPEQKRVFGLIPGLEKADFARYGMMHKNTYINSPRLLDSTYRLSKSEAVYFAGQISGVEGYVESASSGMVAGINAARELLGKVKAVFSTATAIGSLACYVSDHTIRDFQPMNVNFGLMQTLDIMMRDKGARYRSVSEHALDEIRKISSEI